MHDVLSNWWRRALLYYLQDHDAPVPVTTVTHELAARRREAAADQQREPVRFEQMRSQLRQAHVVEMAEFGIVEYDPDDDTVRIPDDVTVTVPAPSSDDEATRR